MNGAPGSETSRTSPPQAAIALAVDDERQAQEVVSQFTPEDRAATKIFSDTGFITADPTANPAEVTILSLGAVRYLTKFHLEQFNEYCGHNRVVLLIRSQDFLDSLAFLEFASGVIFSDATLDRVHEVLELSRAGYSILPPTAVMDIVSDRLRSETIARLNPIELEILDQVRMAKTNRAIARSLNLTEANVKTKVRAILKSLKFQNRTEAAVFAARQGDLIRRQLDQRRAELQGRTEREIDRDTMH